MADSFYRFSTVQVKRSVKALYQLLEKTAEIDNDGDTKVLFDKPPNKISVRIQLKKSLQGRKYGWKELKVVLPFCPVGEDPAVCLFVKDFRKGRKAEDEVTIDNFKEKLSKGNVKNITEIIPFHILKTEYSTFDTKKNLSMNFDKFLIDDRLKMSAPTLLGKWFVEKQKLPIPVKLTKSTLKMQIDKGLRTILIPLFRNKFIYHVNISNDGMSQAETVANILALMNQLAKKIPGKWENVRAVFLSTSVKPSIPVYVSLSPAKNVEIEPDVTVKQEAEELTTLHRGKVIVGLDGSVRVVKGEDEGETSDDDQQITFDDEGEGILELNDEDQEEEDEEYGSDIGEDDKKDMLIDEFERKILNNDSTEMLID